MTIKEAQTELLDDLSIFQDWTERYEYVISLGKKLPLMEDTQKSEDKLIQGCQSQVWLDAEKQDGPEKRVIYHADSDSLITKGMIALFINTLSGQPAEQILTADMSFIDQTGLKEHLAPTRANALNLMARQMKKLALELSM
jgi:cysteine desulfuration protein SufE